MDHLLLYRTLHAVVVGIQSLILALWSDLCGLRAIASLDPHVVHLLRPA